jgi:TolB-like protein/DNA-binding winged helix-turn-helix (wHTH) protein/Tfp pilus assembly protein PilF
MAVTPKASRVRFGVFEADLTSGELRKYGIKIKLNDQPFKVLTLLLEHPGEVITRDQLHQKLWPQGTFVDSDAGLNSAILKLREALGDSAENPRFVETLPRRGYRLLVDVAAVGSKPDAEANAIAPVNGHHKPIPEVPGDPERNPQKGVAAAGSPLISGEFRSRKFTWGAIAVLATAFVLAGIGVWMPRQPSQHYSIAVLPLTNLSADAGSDYFSEGLTDEIISNLSVIDGLEVKSRTSSFAFKDQPRDIHQVGARLGANLVLEGSLLRSGNRLRVNVQLIRVADDSPIWSGRYDREMQDIFAIQENISQSIVNELRLKLYRDPNRYDTSLRVYDDYLKAKALLNGMPGPESNRILTSIPLFEAAVRTDSRFAPAYAGMGNAYAYLSATPRTFSPALAYPKMKEACERALQLDPLLPEANSCIGFVYARNHEWEKAEKSFRRALALNPNLSVSRQDFAIFVLVPLGKIDEAVREARVAVKLDPLSSKAQTWLDFALLIPGRYQEVLDNCQQALVVNPAIYLERQNLARALVQQGRIQEGITVLEKLGEGSESFLGYAYAKAGRAGDAEKIAVAYRNWPWLQAIVYAGLGDKERAYTGLQQMAATGDPRVGTYSQIPELSILKGDPRLAELRRSLNLPTLQ